MVNDVTARGKIRERFQTALFPVTSEGRGVPMEPLYYFTLSQSLPDVGLWMYDSGREEVQKLVLGSFKAI